MMVGMTDKTRIRIAGAVTALFLAGISAVGLATHSHKAPAISAPVAAAVQPAASTAQSVGDDHQTREVERNE